MVLISKILMSISFYKIQVLNTVYSINNSILQLRFTYLTT